MPQTISHKSRRLTFPQREGIILEAALRQFSEKGFKGATTKTIAAKAGVNEALLYRHYPTKENLYFALLKDKMKRFEVRFLPELEKTLKLPPAAGMARIAALMVQKMKADKALMRMALFAALERPRFTRLFFRQRLPLLTFLERFIRHHQKAGRIRRVRPKILARAFFAMVYHYFMVRFIFQAPKAFFDAQDRLFRDYVNFLLKGVMR